MTTYFIKMDSRKYDIVMKKIRTTAKKTGARVVSIEDGTSFFKGEQIGHHTTRVIVA